MRHTPSLIRNLFALAITVFLIVSCENKRSHNNGKTEELSPAEISLSPIRRDSLSSEQLVRIKEIQIAFAEVNPSTLEETIDNFKRDQNPDHEIAIWTSMSNTYKDFVEAKAGKLSIEEKKEVYALILLRSMMSEDEAKKKAGLKLLSDADVKHIFSLYNHAPSPPITVEKN